MNNKFLKSSIAIILFALISFFSTTTLSYATSNTANSGFFRKLNYLKNMHANFEQVLINQQQDLRKKSSGEVWIRKPSYFKWQTQKPAQSMLLSNGRKLIHYDKELAQITVTKVPKKISQAPYLLLLTGNDRVLSKLFMIQKINSETYRLTPKSNAQSLIKNIQITFWRSLPKRIIINTGVGQSTLIQFYNISTARIADSVYEFTPPKGVDILG